MHIHFTADAPSHLDCDLVAVAAGAEYETELAELDQALGGALVSWLKSQNFKGSAGSAKVFPTLGRIPAANLAIVGCGDGSLGSIRQAAAKAGREARALGAETVALALGSNEVQALVESFAAGNYVYDKYTPETRRKAPTHALHLIGAEQDDAATRAATQRVTYQNWARDLVNAPPADIYPETLAAAAKGLESIPNVSVEVLDFETCRQRGMVGIIAVGQGSARPGCLIHVRYTPPTSNDHIALVGKGVTFDAGGLSIKPSAAMQTMRCDMGGAAAALGATAAIAAQGLPITVDTFVGAVENMVGANSFKLGDILEYRNGVTVEIHNTDAEGRLVLADCLIEACNVDGVTRIVDLATLTGACVIAVGEDFTGLFTDDDALAAELHAAADQTGEGLWRLPFHKPYNDKLKGEWGQIKNVGGRAAGATTAALYLSHFVAEGTRWAHLDVAGSAFHDHGGSRYAAGATGEMVRSLATWAQRLAQQ